MSKIRQKLIAEYVNAYDLGIKKKYSKPKIYNAGGNLAKRWYVYFSFRNPLTDKLERQVPVYQGVNQFENLKDRTEAIKILRDAVEGILRNGYDPFTDENSAVDEAKKLNIPQAIELALELKKQSAALASFNDFSSRLKQFEKWLLANGFTNRYITAVNKTAIINYLNSVLMASSAANRNNTRAVISQFYTILVDNEIVETNLVSRINIIATRPERNKSFSTKQENDLLDYLEKNDAQLLLFILFVSYNFLRPIEVVRLKIKDVNINDLRLYIRAKNKPVKIKIIPVKMLEKMPDISKFDSESHLFTPHGHGVVWETNETDKRGYFTKRFGKVKKIFKMGKDYGIYSFRHTFITKLYRELVIGSTPYEAKSKLMLITGHTTMKALEKYLRDIDAVLPDDYSHYIK